MRSINIKAIVKDLIEKYKTNDVVDLCERLNISILTSDLGPEINGFFQRTPCGVNIIHLNTRLDYEMTKYILAHELGHAILHTNLSIMLFIENKNLIKNRYENEADKFAAELLLLDKNIGKVAFSEMNIEQIAKTLYIPEKLIRLKYNLEI